MPLRKLSRRLGMGVQLFPSFVLLASLAACEKPAPKHPEVETEQAEKSPAPVETPAEEKSEFVPPSAETVIIERERALASAAFRKSNASPDHLGLRATLVARTADLPWLFAVRNDGPEAVDVLADPSLLEFEVAPGEEATPATTAPTTKKFVAKKPPPKVLCRAGSAPTKAEPAKFVTLAPGALLTYSFDPRPLCEAEGTLAKGKKILPSYGFPITSKKVWKSGKSMLVTNESEAPFVAHRSTQTEASPVPLKGLALETFTLDETYPLEGVLPLGTAPAEDPSGKSDIAGREGETAPELPLKLSVKPLGTVADADETVVNVSLKNRGKESITIFFRREHIVYEIQGPLGATSCRMFPSDRAPEAVAFDKLSPGEVSSYATRLAEACPLGTFDTPGIYNVSARLEARQSGSEASLAAFVGNVFSTEPARLTVKGSNKAPRLTPVMRIVAPEPQATPNAPPSAGPAEAPSEAPPASE